MNYKKIVGGLSLLLSVGSLFSGGKDEKRTLKYLARMDRRVEEGHERAKEIRKAAVRASIIKRMQIDFFTACLNNDRDKAFSLIPHIDINGMFSSVTESASLKEESQRSALSLACRSGFTDVVKLLLQQEDLDVNKGVTIKRKEDLTTYSPLSIVLSNGHIEIARLLLNDERVNLNQGISIKSRNGDYTEISPFCGCNNLEILKLFFDKSFDYENMHIVKDKKKKVKLRRSLLFILLNRRFNDCTEEEKEYAGQAFSLILNKSKKEGTIDSEIISSGASFSLLFYVVELELIDLVRILLQEGADVNKKSTRKSGAKESPLYCASRAGSLEVVQELLKYHPHLCSKHGVKAFDIANAEIKDAVANHLRLHPEQYPAREEFYPSLFAAAAAAPPVAEEETVAEEISSSSESSSESEEAQSDSLSSETSLELESGAKAAERPSASESEATLSKKSKVESAPKSFSHVFDGDLIMHPRVRIWKQKDVDATLIKKGYIAGTGREIDFKTDLYERYGKSHIIATHTFSREIDSSILFDETFGWVTPQESDYCYEVIAPGYMKKEGQEAVFGAYEFGLKIAISGDRIIQHKFFREYSGKEFHEGKSEKKRGRWKIHKDLDSYPLKSKVKIEGSDIEFGYGVPVKY